jgi:hypothetical protein
MAFTTWLNTPHLVLRFILLSLFVTSIAVASGKPTKPTPPGSFAKQFHVLTNPKSSTEAIFAAADHLIDSKPAQKSTALHLKLSEALDQSTLPAEQLEMVAYTLAELNPTLSKAQQALIHYYLSHDDDSVRKALHRLAQKGSLTIETERHLLEALPLTSTTTQRNELFEILLKSAREGRHDKEATLLYAKHGASFKDLPVVLWLNIALAHAEGSSMTVEIQHSLDLGFTFAEEIEKPEAAMAAQVIGASIPALVQKETYFPFPETAMARLIALTRSVNPNTRRQAYLGLVKIYKALRYSMVKPLFESIRLTHDDKDKIQGAIADLLAVHYEKESGTIKVELGKILSTLEQGYTDVQMCTHHLLVSDLKQIN